MKTKNYIRFILLTALLILVTIKQGPLLLQSFQSKGDKISEAHSFYIMDGTPLIIPKDLDGDRKIIIFWVSWCRACHIELNRFQKAVDNGDLNSQNILAINSFEPMEQAKAFIKKNNYSFQFINDRGELRNELDIQGTPTVIHLKENKVQYFYTGISPMSVWRAKRFLDH